MRARRAAARRDRVRAKTGWLPLTLPQALLLPSELPLPPPQVLSKSSRLRVGGREAPAARRRGGQAAAERERPPQPHWLFLALPSPVPAWNLTRLIHRPSMPDSFMPDASSVRGQGQVGA